MPGDSDGRFRVMLDCDGLSLPVLQIEVTVSFAPASFGGLGAGHGIAS